MLREFLSHNFAREDLRRLLDIVRAYAVSYEQLTAEEDSLYALTSLSIFLDAQPRVGLVTETEGWGRLRQIVESFDAAFWAPREQGRWYGIMPLTMLEDLLAFLLDGTPLPESLVTEELGAPTLFVDHRLAVTADHQTIVDATEPTAAYIWCGEGREIPLANFEGYQVSEPLRQQIEASRQQYRWACEAYERAIRQQIESRGDISVREQSYYS